MDNSAKNFPPIQGGALILLTLALSLATFMQVLDSTIANVAILLLRAILAHLLVKVRG